VHLEKFSYTAEFIWK